MTPEIQDFEAFLSILAFFYSFFKWVKDRLALRRQKLTNAGLHGVVMDVQDLPERALVATGKVPRDGHATGVKDPEDDLVSLV